MIVIGIDPGKDGGYVELDELGRVRFQSRLYLDRGIDRLDELQWDQVHCFMERAQVMNREGRPTSARSMFNYGQAFGEILGRLAAFRIPHTLVRPADWSRIMHAGTTDDHNTKKRSLQAARQLWPGTSWIPAGCKQPHDGIYEAALIAEYGRRRLQGDES
jgi:hypothetical protein